LLSGGDFWGAVYSLLTPNRPQASYFTRSSFPVFFLSLPSKSITLVFPLGMYASFCYLCFYEYTQADCRAGSRAPPDSATLPPSTSSCPPKLRTRGARVFLQPPLLIHTVRSVSLRPRFPSLLLSCLDESDLPSLLSLRAPDGEPFIPFGGRCLQLQNVP